MDWVIQQLREATPFGCQPRYLFRDNDGIFGHGVRAFLISCGILEVRTSYQSPWQNPYVERFIGTLCVCRAPVVPSWADAGLAPADSLPYDLGPVGSTFGRRSLFLRESAQWRSMRRRCH